MNYVERLKARLGHVGQAYELGGESAPNRPLPVEDSRLIGVTNQLVDLMIAARIKGVDWRDVLVCAEQWADYEWTLAEPLIEAAKTQRAAEQPQAA